MASTLSFVCHQQGAVLTDPTHFAVLGYDRQHFPSTCLMISLTPIECELFCFLFSFFLAPSPLTAVHMFPFFTSSCANSEPVHFN